VISFIVNIGPKTSLWQPAGQGSSVLGPQQQGRDGDPGTSASRTTRRRLPATAPHASTHQRSGQTSASALIWHWSWPNAALLRLILRVRSTRGSSRYQLVPTPQLASSPPADCCDGFLTPSAGTLARLVRFEQMGRHDGRGRAGCAGKHPPRPWWAGSRPYRCRRQPAPGASTIRSWPVMVTAITR
jgi:hypothetical protein